jgi:hypothetical protein
MTEIRKAIIQTLIYFDLFSFPLREEELYRYCRVKTTRATLRRILDELVGEGWIDRTGAYYQLSPRSDRIERRERNREVSLRKLRAARRNAALISQFPFVRGVAISGSLSKYAADEAADIDFFIITKAGRLWICRSFLHLFKKLTYLFGGQHGFCMNYFLDESELELKDKNIFTALESVTIIPVYGAATHAAFYDDNAWLYRYFPNMDPCRRLRDMPSSRRTWPKRFLEAFFRGRWGDRFNRWIMRRTVAWWRYKFHRQGYPPHIFDRALRSTPGESKYHPNDYQPAVLNAYREKLQHLSRRIKCPSKTNNACPPQL